MFLLLLMLSLKLFSAAELRRRFPFEMWLIVSSALAISQAVLNSGLMETAMLGLSPLLAELSPTMMLVLIYALTLAMTELMTNNAAAALMFPIGYSIAVTTGLEPMAFVMAVALGGSASFLTPYGYATNLMVQNLGWIFASRLHSIWLVGVARLFECGVVVTPASLSVLARTAADCDSHAAPHWRCQQNDR